MKVNLKIPSPSNKTWTVKGKTIEELFKNLNAHGFWGRYRSNPGSKYAGKTKKIDTITVNAKPVIIMPKWPGYSKATKEEKKSWDTMWKALKKHEDEHHVIFDKAAKEWKSTMEGGDDLEKKDTDKAWNKFITDTQKKQDAFDTKTSHGEKTGVVLTVP